MTTWLPMAWVNFRLIGGATLLTTTLAAGGAILLFSTLSQSWGPWDKAAHAGFWLSLVTVGVAVSLLIMVPSVVRKIVQRDFQTGMMESHRLSPMTGMQMVCGYLVGAAIQPLALCAVFLLFGTYFSGVYAVSMRVPVLLTSILGGWYAALLCLGVMSLLLASLSLVAAIATSGKWNLVPIVFVAGILGGWSVIPLVPGAALLFGFSSGSILMDVIQNGTLSGPPQTLLAAMLVQLVLSVVTIGGAAELIRSDRPGVFTLPRAALLTFLWGVVLFVGMFYSDARGLFSMQRPPLFVEMLLSLISLVAVAQFALYAAAGERVALDTACAFGAARKPVAAGLLVASPAFLAAFGVLVMVGLSVARRVSAPDSVERGFETFALAGAAALRPGPMAWVFASVLLGFVVDLSLYYFAIARRWRVFFPLVASFLVLRLAPVVLEFAQAVMQDTIDEEIPRGGVVLACSPFGTLFLALSGGSATTISVGLAVQACAAALSILLARLARPTATRAAGQAVARSG